MPTIADDPSADAPKPNKQPLTSPTYALRSSPPDLAHIHNNRRELETPQRQADGVICASISPVCYRQWISIGAPQAWVRVLDHSAEMSGFFGVLFTSPIPSIMGN